MGRRNDEKLDDEVPQEVVTALDELFEAFGRLRFPNRAMVVLAELALSEYRLARRSIDRKHWHGQLVAVAKVCQEFSSERGESSADDELGVVSHDDEGGDEREHGGDS